jgi:hypothetical protein
VTSTFSTHDTPEAVKASLAQAPAAPPAETERPEKVEVPAPEVIAATQEGADGGFVGWIKRLFGRG